MLNQEKPWTMNGSQWLTANGIHEPWIAEISPVQYARMGKAAKRRYDEKRNAELNASHAGKQDWAQAVLKAHDRGDFDWKDSDVHPEAKSVVLGEKVKRDKADKKAAKDAADRENRIHPRHELKVGDRVYSVIYGYAVLTKINKKTVRGDMERTGGSMLLTRTHLQWLSPIDLKKANR